MITFDVNGIVHVSTGLLSGSAFLLGVVNLSEFLIAKEESCFYRFMSGAFGLMLLLFGMATFTAPFALAKWQWFPNTIPTTSETALGFFIGGFICGAAVILCRQRQRLPKFRSSRPKTRGVLG